MNTNQRFIKNLCYLQKKHGKTNEQMANRLRVSRETFRSWKRRNVIPFGDFVVEISLIFQVTMDDLFTAELFKADEGRREMEEAA